jgi:hypothetical protein
VSKATTLAVSVAGLVITVVACDLIELDAINWWNVLAARYGPTWAGLTVNIIPTFLTGFLLFCCVAITLPSCDRQRGWRSHVVRVSPLYICGTILLVFVVWQWPTNHDFRYVAQLFVWPIFGIVGGVLGDVVGTAVSRWRVAAPSAGHGHL